MPARGEVWIAASHPALPLFAFERINPDWGFEPGLILKPLAAVSGQCCNEDGTPLAGVELMVNPREGYGPIWLVERAAGQSGAGEPPPSDAEGKWSVDVIIPGMEYYVTVRRPGSNSWKEITDFTALPGETVDLGTLTLPE